MMLYQDYCDIENLEQNLLNQLIDIEFNISNKILAILE